MRSVASFAHFFVSNQPPYGARADIAAPAFVYWIHAGQVEHEDPFAHGHTSLLALIGAP